MRRYGATMASNRQVTGGGQPSWPELTAAQMREVDRIMIEELGIDLLQMMELAGAHLADLAVRMVGPRTATVLAGTGGNGGGGLVAARHLANRGVRAAVTLAGSPAAGTVTAHQLDILGRIGVPVVKDPPGADVVLDALIGYSLRGDPTGAAAQLIAWANRQPAPVLSLDVPSGFDAATGRTRSPCVAAAATLTLAAPKVGLRGSPATGQLYVADIGVPPPVLARIGLPAGALFPTASVIHLP
jgi:NAD(P)H-hydrate epimerase